MENGSVKDGRAGSVLESGAGRAFSAKLPAAGRPKGGALGSASGDPAWQQPTQEHA